MSDIKEILEHTARAADTPPPADLVEADVRRGRAALVRIRRRRAIRSTALGAAAAILAGTSFAVVNTIGDDNGASTVTLPDRIESSAGPGNIQLVAYTGEQLDGFIVDRMPAGWILQGSSPFNLTIAPDGDTSHPDNFVGKLVVMLLSGGAKQELPDGEAVKVGDRDGVVVRHGRNATLTYEDGDGHFVQVQCPPVLGWTNDQLARFAEGVQVTGDARQGHG